MPESKRYLGLELAGAKNKKSSLAALEYYPTEKKVFLLDIFDHIANDDDQTGDDALLEVIQEMDPEGQSQMGVNVALELPPCIPCTRQPCPLPQRCIVPGVKWMRELTLSQTSPTREFTPYTQRPIELWVRYEVLPHLPTSHRFEIDETLGGNRAPLTARMHFLKRHLKSMTLYEIWPKLTVAILCAELGIHRRIISTYRSLEDGIYSREEILTQITQQKKIFIYERDLRKLATNLTAFDAFICAFTALLADLNQTAKPPLGFPIESGWIQFPVGTSLNLL